MFAQQQPSTAAPGPSASTQDLQKATQNPVASLISVPIQNTSNFNSGPFDRTQNDLNIQPVIPTLISENWILITRLMHPVVWQPFPDQPVGGQFGFGDMNPTFFFSPVKHGRLIWGAGPTLLIPTATSSLLGQGKFEIGPSAVALVQPGHWTIGALVSDVWSVSGDSKHPDVNQMTLQYFVNYNLSNGWYFAIASIITANWELSSPNRWTVPAGGGIGRIMRIGFQPVNLSCEFYGNPVRPNGSYAQEEVAITRTTPKIFIRRNAPFTRGFWELLVLRQVALARGRPP